jgi:hypothetical protein
MSTSRTWRLTIAALDGRPLCTLLLTREQPAPPAPPAEAVDLGAAPLSMPNGSPSVADPEPRMTEPQRRYLFRLLAAGGLEPKAAEAHLRERLQVPHLRDVTKTAASQLIDQLVTATTPEEAPHVRP